VEFFAEEACSQLTKRFDAGRDEGDRKGGVMYLKKEEKSHRGDPIEGGPGGERLANGAAFREITGSARIKEGEVGHAVLRGEGEKRRKKSSAATA